MRTVPIRCGLSMTRCTSSQRLSPSNSTASQCCSGTVLICFPTFHVQFHGQITVNSVVACPPSSALSRTGIRTKENCLSFRAHLPLSCTGPTLAKSCSWISILTLDALTLEVGDENSHEKVVLRAAPCSVAAG